MAFEPAQPAPAPKPSQKQTVAADSGAEKSS
jgi:hypothetical protein